MNLDFEHNHYKVIYKLLNKKTNKSGLLELKKKEEVTQLKLSSFHPNIFVKIFEIWILRCSLDGSVKFNHSKKQVSGGEQITISELL